ncbi:MAG: biotin--[acetyl-CoA-carboxylase] ligase [Alphaproteobacteria bacterium GM7ARS4]|nr:biotin--[acetyl-CoA-carboxylase] ligase [Alphaproteobacteria bacterium GM7ARS4]
MGIFWRWLGYGGKHLCVMHKRCVGSSNDVARQRLHWPIGEGGQGEGLVIKVDRQLAGRGRRGKRWVSRRGNLHCSFVLVPSVSQRHYPQLSFMASLALMETLRSLCRHPAWWRRVSCKWPNDVLCDGKKLAGILLEHGLYRGRSMVIMGVGVNVRFAPPLRRVTSLYACGIMSTEAEVFKRFALFFWRRYRLWQEKEAHDMVYQEWLCHAYRLGGFVRLHMDGEKVEGMFEGLTSDGRLCVRMRNSEVRHVSSALVET